MKTLLIIVTVCALNTVTSSVVSQDWKDPHDMNTNAKRKYLRALSSDSSFGNDAEKSEAFNSQSTYLFNLKRIVSVLMKAAHIDKENPALYQGHIRFAIKPEDHQFLLNFGKEDITSDTLRDLDTIFSEGFQKSYIDGYLDNVRSFQTQLYAAVVNIETLWIVGTAYMVYFVHQLMKNGFSLRYVAKFIVLLVLITDFGFRHYHLLEEIEEHNLKVIYSSKCDTRKMSWTEWAQFLLGSQKCEKRSVTPLDTLLHQVKHLIIVPMQAVGTGMGGFGSNMFSSLPFPLNFIMWPILLIFTLLMALITLTVLSGYPIEFNIFHLIKLKFGGTDTNYASLTNSMLKMLVDKVQHRPIVHNVNISLPSAVPANNELKDEKMRIEDVADPPLEHTLAAIADRSCHQPAEDSALEETNCMADAQANTPKQQNSTKTAAEQSLAADKDVSPNQQAGSDVNVFHLVKLKLSDAGKSDNLRNSIQKILDKTASTDLRIEDVSDPPLEQISTGRDDSSYNQPADDNAHEKTCSPEDDVDLSVPENLSKFLEESLIKEILASEAELCDQLAGDRAHEKASLLESYGHPPNGQKICKHVADPSITQIFAVASALRNKPAKSSS